jgi:hypothetical protein
MNDSMSKMISCVLNFPSLVNEIESLGVIEERIKKLTDSKLLLELIENVDILSNEININVSKKILLESFEDNLQFYNKLKELSTNDPFVDKKNATNEFLNALSQAEQELELSGSKSEQYDIEKRIAELSESTDDDWEKTMEVVRNRHTPKAVEETIDIETLKKERDALLVQNESLKSRIDFEYKVRTEDFVSKDEVKSESNNWLFVAGYMVFLLIAWLSVDGYFG